MKAEVIPIRHSLPILCLVSLLFSFLCIFNMHIHIIYRKWWFTVILLMRRAYFPHTKTHLDSGDVDAPWRRWEGNLNNQHYVRVGFVYNLARSVWFNLRRPKDVDLGLPASHLEFKTGQFGHRRCRVLFACGDDETDFWLCDCIGLDTASFGDYFFWILFIVFVFVLNDLTNNHELRIYWRIAN